MIDESPSDRDRGVSEVLGYILIFGIVLSIITIAMLSGPSLIDNTESAQSAQTVIYNFHQLDDQVKKVQYGANQRFFRTEFPPGELSQLPPTYVNITDGNTWSNHSTAPIVYKNEGDKYVIYESRIIAAKPNGHWSTDAQIVTTPPSLARNGDDTFFITEIRTLQSPFSASSTQTNSRTFLINKTNVNQPPKTHQFDINQDVTLHITSEVPTLWHTYLDSKPTYTVTTDRDSYTPGTRQTIVVEKTVTDSRYTTVSRTVHTILLS